MEGKKEVVASNSCSSSSFTNEIFGSRDSGSSSSSGIFKSIFSPSKLFGRESMSSEVVDKKLEFGTKSAAPDTYSRDKKDGDKSAPKKENNLFDEEQRVQPCHLSSSIYYGGQDDYNTPNKTTQSSSYPTYNKDGLVDDEYASRGNWWQGSLYY